MEKQPRRDSTSTSTISAIKTYLLENGLRPGDPMPSEAELCRRLSVSRTSVREAIRTLVALDIVEVRHGVGTFVGQLSLRPLVDGLVFRGVLTPGDDFAALREVVEVRTAHELSVSALMIEKIRGTKNPELHQLVDEMIELADQGKSFPAQDRAFHSLMYARLDNKLFGQLAEAFWDVHSMVSPRLGVASNTDISETARAHKLMLETAEDGDVEAYVKAVVAHYQPLHRVLDQSEYSSTHTRNME